ncbi:hypothetical protein ONS95_014770 [Cadophora gregata]|uniref:uncharacterized protein n=1 Tax=Cadophora gregata TaxID=51156 RepID=UPI0026DCD398|nr:uncharacterized protein ONS95_014770 [Cadophora gregata]KAK0113064.1 hypothetical protein ONS95_014770 [Cadophora gregata]
MMSVSFEFSTPGCLRTALDNLQCSSMPSLSKDVDYLSPLQKLAIEFGRSVVGEYGLENALALSTGCYRDIVVVLQEPTYGASYLCPAEMVAQSYTINWIDEILCRSTGGVRTWSNTRIFDIRPFRNARWREEDASDSRERFDEMAYQTFEEMIRLAKPDVVLVCQCETAQTAKNKLAIGLSSSITSAGTLRVLEILGRKTIIVNGFHPSYFTRQLWARDDAADDKHGQLCRRKNLALLSEGLLKFAFLAAVNAAAGRKITGFGRANLSRCALNGPVSRMERVDNANGEQSLSITLTYEWISKADIASPKLIEKMKRRPVGIEITRRSYLTSSTRSLFASSDQRRLLAAEGRTSREDRSQAQDYARRV